MHWSCYLLTMRDTEKTNRFLLDKGGSLVITCLPSEFLLDRVGTVRDNEVSQYPLVRVIDSAIRSCNRQYIDRCP